MKSVIKPSILVIGLALFLSSFAITATDSTQHSKDGAVDRSSGTSRPEANPTPDKYYKAPIPEKGSAEERSQAILKFFDLDKQTPEERKLLEEKLLAYLDKAQDKKSIESLAQELQKLHPDDLMSYLIILRINFDTHAPGKDPIYGKDIDDVSIDDSPGQDGTGKDRQKDKIKISALIDQLLESDVSKKIQIENYHKSLDAARSSINGNNNSPTFLDSKLPKALSPDVELDPLAAEQARIAQEINARSENKATERLQQQLQLLQEERDAKREAERAVRDMNLRFKESLKAANPNPQEDPGDIIKELRDQITNSGLQNPKEKSSKITSDNFKSKKYPKGFDESPLEYLRRTGHPLNKADRTEDYFKTRRNNSP